MSPGTRLVKKSWVQVQSHWIPVHKTMISRVFCNHTVNLKTDSKTPFCVVPEYIHTLPREDSFICTPDLPGFSLSGVFDDFQNLKFAILPIKTDIPQAVAFLVFLGIALSIRESMSASDKIIVKLWVSQSYCVMTLVCWIYTTAITPQ